MKYLSIVFLIFYSSYIYSATINVSGNVSDMNNVPIANHWVVIEINDTVSLYNSIDSVQSSQIGDYVYSISNVGINPGAIVDIRTRDCVGMVHSLISFFPGGNNYDFNICSNYVPQTCNAQFTFYEDNQNQGTFHFVNQSTNNAINLWKINGNIVSQQANFTYTFTTNFSTNIVCLEILDSSQSCGDTACSTVIVNNCSTSFNYNTNGLNVDFNVQIPTNADFYTWDFGDGNVNSTSNVVIQHTYSNYSNYNVILKAFNIYNQDTCIATDSQLVNVISPSPSGKLFGYVFIGNNYLDVGEVVLYSKNPSSNKLVSIDTVGLKIDSISSSSFYEFNGIMYGDYYIKCIIPNNSLAFNEYIDTWASQDANVQIVHWQDAEQQSLNAEQMVANINLKKADVFFSGGVSVISGNIINTAGVNTINQLLFLLNHNHKIVEAIQPDINGDFEFDSLIYGTYYLRPELTNYYSIDYQVVINSANPNVGNIILSVDSNHFYTNIKGINDKIDFKVFPNPVVDNLKIEIPINYYNVDRVKIEIYNSIGELLSTEYRDILPNSVINLSFVNKNNGFYMVVVSGSYGVFVEKIIKTGATN